MAAWHRTGADTQCDLLQPEAQTDAEEHCGCADLYHGPTMTITLPARPHPNNRSSVNGTSHADWGQTGCLWGSQDTR